MRDNLYGVIIPDVIIERMEQATDAKAESGRICAELMQQLNEIPVVAGAHLMAPDFLSESSSAFHWPDAFSASATSGGM